MRVSGRTLKYWLGRIWCAINKIINLTGLSLGSLHSANFNATHISFLFVLLCWCVFVSLCRMCSSLYQLLTLVVEYTTHTTRLTFEANSDWMFFDHLCIEILHPDPPGTLHSKQRASCQCIVMANVLQNVSNHINSPLQFSDLYIRKKPLVSVSLSSPFYQGF